MKKISLLLIALLLLGSFAACGTASDAGASAGRKAGTLSIVITIFPEYDWVQNVLGENPADAEVTLLLDNGVDLHSYQPSSEDILKIAESDVFVYVGGESDEWVEDVLQQSPKENRIVINLLEALGDRAKEEETVEGMQEEGEDGADSAEYDEHVWLSLRNAAFLVNVISETLQSADTEHAAIYRANAQNYIEQLEALDAAYGQAVSEAGVSTLLFGDRFPFRYLTDDYGLSYYAAFAGCSAETEASFETILFLARKMDELSLSAVLTIEGTDHRIAETIVQNTQAKDQQILTLDSMQSVTAKDMQDGSTYLSIMEKNLEVLRSALGTVPKVTVFTENGHFMGRITENRWKNHRPRILLIRPEKVPKTGETVCFGTVPKNT